MLDPTPIARPEFSKPSGLTEVAIDNTTFGTACQNGSMDDVVLSFGCAQ